MDSSTIDAEQGNNLSRSNKKFKGIRRPSVLLVVLFWHHVVFTVICAWSAIGLIAMPDAREMLAGILVMVSVQTICAISGIAGAHQKNMKFIYYFGCSQVVLAAMELFWAFSCVFSRMLLMFFVLLMFCLYQCFLCSLAFRYKTVECEWRILGYIWPFNIGVHPNHLPSAADKINEQPSELPFPLYASFSETLAQHKKPHMSVHPHTDELSSSKSSSLAAPIPSACGGSAVTTEAATHSKLVDARQLEHSHTLKDARPTMDTQQTLLKSVHPTTSDVSATSSVSSGTMMAAKPMPDIAEIMIKTGDIVDVPVQHQKANEMPSKTKTAIAKPSTIDQPGRKKLSPTLTDVSQIKADETSSSKAPIAVMEKIFGPTTSLSTPERLKQQNSSGSNNNGKKKYANGGTDKEHLSKKNRRPAASPIRSVDDRHYYRPELQLPLSPSASVEETKAAQRNCEKTNDSLTTAPK